MNETQAANHSSASPGESKSGENEKDHADDQPKHIESELTENTNEPEQNTVDENEQDQENGDDKEFPQVDIDEDMDGIFSDVDNKTVSR